MACGGHFGEIKLSHSSYASSRIPTPAALISTLMSESSSTTGVALNSAGWFSPTCEYGASSSSILAGRSCLISAVSLESCLLLRRSENAKTARQIPTRKAAVPIPTPNPKPAFAPVERAGELWAGQAASDGQLVGIDEVKLIGGDEGVEIGDEDENVEVGETVFDRDEEDDEARAEEAEGDVDDEDEDEEDWSSANSCCGDGTWKVSRLGTEQSRLPEP